MKFVRYAYETINHKYEIEIDEDYIKSLNDDLNKMMGDKEHPAITLEMVIAVASHDELPAQCHFVIGETRYYGNGTIADFIWDCLNQDIWEGDDEILDSDVEDYTDEVELEPEEEERYNEYVQMSIFDDETGDQ